jgi:spermidine/putrescine transport system substrate-binding protein
MMKTFFTALAALLLLTPGASFASGGKVLYLFNWSEYMPREILEQFTEETGVKVVETTYDSNEAMYAKLKLLQGDGYDLAVPSAEYVSRMRKEGLLVPLNKTLLPNFKNLDPKLLNEAFDPDNVFSVPYMWGTTGVSLNTGKFPADSVSGYADLWKPEFKGSLLLPDEMRSVMGIGLKTLGYSINDVVPAHIEEAYALLKKLMPSVKIFDSGNPKQALLNGEAGAAVLWNGEAYVANQENSAIAYIYPKEGALKWVDNMVIPKGAKHVEEAHAFINFILRPDVAVAISEELGYATPNAAAMPLLPQELRENPIAYPTPDDLKNSEYENDLGPVLALYEKAWTRLKTGN